MGSIAPTIEFCMSLNSFLTGGTNYAHHITIHPPDFQTFLRPFSWHYDLNNFDRLIAAR